jgi:hypothetical protein
MDTENKASAAQFLTEYYRAFSTLRLELILPYFHEPCLLAGPQGAMAMSSHAELAAVLTPVFDGLRARGYARSELAQLRVHRLSATDTLATGVAVRIKQDGQELERVGVTYLLHQAGAWRIALLVNHDAANDLQA